AGGAAATPAQGATAPAATVLGPTVPGPTGLGGAAPTSGAAGPGATAGASTVVALPPPDSPEGMLLAAKNELGAGRTQNALTILDSLLAKYPAGMDEAYYLYGVALEQNGPLKDIRRAYSYYKKVVDEYPESPFWDKANERVSYIERYYFDIR
ncbi:MAG: tetratricopeptide repeat protein, partial [Treponema sp.]|nr:tetratricopeptide repeat protein [Treponema sp.]